VRPSAMLALSMFLLLSAQLFADQVSLKNGDRLSGTIVKSDGKTLVLHTDYAGDINVDWKAIQGIQSGQELHVQLQDGRTVAGPVSGSNDKLQIVTKSGATVDTNLSSVNGLRNNAEEAAYEKTLHPGLLQGWKTGLNLGYALTRGNSETSNLALGFIGSRQTQTDKLGLYANAVYAKSTLTVTSSTTPPVTTRTTTTTANTAAGGTRYDHNLRDDVFGFVSADFFSDALQGLNLRSVFSAGAGYHLIKNPDTTLDVLAGANYTRESYTVLKRNEAALTLGEELMHKLGKSTVLNEKLYFFPDLSSAGDFRGTFDFGTVTKLSKYLGWQNSFSDVYVTNPPPTKRQNDIILTTGLNVSWGQ
jgi:putative salt-induced outer membrane protein YdiY